MSKREMWQMRRGPECSTPREHRWGLCLALTLALAGLPCSAALAQETVMDGDPTGMYVGATFNLGVDNFEETAGLSLDTDVGLGGGLWIGYRAAKLAAVELRFDGLNFGGDATLQGVGTVDLDVETLLFTANGKIYGSDGTFQPYAMVGIGVGAYDATASAGGASATDGETGFVARFGAGADIYLTRNVAFTPSVAYVLSTGDLEDTDFISIGLGIQYWFH